jgi:AmmeMemoRadiSam system protein B
MASVRPPAVAGLFYPGNAFDLARTVDGLLEQGAPAQAFDVPKAIIAPHAGFVYSGPVAARVYARFATVRRRIRRVILLGPAHRVAVRGMALPGVSAFATPLGEVPIDEDSAAQLLKLPFIGNSTEAHRQEHCLEVHLPFFQKVFDQFTLVPLAVGRATAEEVAQVLELLWGGEETLIVVSSDLSHYHPYAEAQAIDKATAQAILALSTGIHHEQACGATPVTGLNLYAKRHGLRPELIDLRNSGDTAGDKARVVGYASFAYHEQPPHNT